MTSNSLDLDQAIIIALGSNLAGRRTSPEAVLEAALANFPSVGLTLVKRSNLWRSAAWPDQTGPEYRNGVALVEADCGPEAVLEALMRIEASFGRTRRARNAPRTLDLDLIAYGREVRGHRSLTLPHPRAHERLFVMGPLAQIAPAWIHPVLGLSAQELARTAQVGRDAAPLSADQNSKSGSD